MSGIVKTRAIVLSRNDWGNTSRIYSFLTLNRGRLNALLKGARRVKGRPGLGGGLDLLSENEILYYQRRAGLAVLAEWSEVSTAAALGEDAVRFAAAEACAELARECSVEEVGEPELYRLLAAAVGQVVAAERMVPLTLSFALGALRIAGLGPHVDSCAACGAADGGARKDSAGLLSGEEGGLVCAGCARGPGRESGAPQLSAESVALLRALVRLELPAAARLRPSRRAEGVLLRAVSHYASWRLERRIRGLLGLASIIAGLEAVGCR